jgi:arsenite-transporting ATPase
MAARSAPYDLPIVFFGGKGGVGKTTLASAVAVVQARVGRRTLLVSTDPAHSTGDMLGMRLGPDPCAVLANLDAVEIDPGLEADRYITEVKERIADVTPPRLIAEVERQIDIARLTPGAEEAALFLRFTRFVEEAGRRWDRIVFDTAPLGHTLRLLALPEQMTAWMSGLALRRKKVTVLSRMWRTVAGAAAGDDGRPDAVLDALEARVASFRHMRRALTDATRTTFVFVATPERLSLLETERGVATLKRHGIPVGGVVVNRVRMGGEDERRHLEHVAAFEDLFDGCPVHEMPDLSGDVHGRDGIERVVDVLPWPGPRPEVDGP